MIGVKCIISNKNTDNIQDKLAKYKIRANMPIINCLQIKKSLNKNCQFEFSKLVLASIICFSSSANI
jgi:hypothetical protein